MARATPKESAHELTIEGITRLVAGYTADRREAVAELIVIERSRQASSRDQPAEPTDFDQRVRNEALRRINGYALPSDIPQTPAGREAELKVTISALDMVISP